VPVVRYSIKILAEVKPQRYTKASLKFIGHIARPARSLTPHTRIGVAIEVMRVTPHNVLPIVEETGIFAGWLTEATLVHALLAATEEGTTHRLRHEPLLSLVTQPPTTLLPDDSIATALDALSTHHVSALPVVNASGHYQGVAGHTDMVEDLIRPLQLPTIGGMATPLGVYLTNGNQSGGVGYVGLLLTGLLLFSLQLVVMAIVMPLTNALEHAAFFIHLPKPLREAGEGVLVTTLHAFLLLGLVRFSPMAGYHAAEHQVVHALERSEPLLPEIIKNMPRIHPRCGTNLVSGIFLLGLGETFQPLLGLYGYPIFALIALLYWRHLGSWVQKNLTTRPAKPNEIESGIKAAQSLLQQDTRATSTQHLHPMLAPLLRLWCMGILQIASGFLTGVGVLWLLMHLFPALNHLLLPYWNQIVH
jgi:CBS domain-containing protein